MKIRQKGVAPTSLVLATMLAVACTEAPQILEPEAVMPVSAAAAKAAFPTGTYLSVLTAGDFPPGFPQEFIDLLAGDWTLDFSDPRISVIRLNGEVVVQSRSTLTPARWIMHDVAGVLGCHLDASRDAHAVYAWAFSDNALTFTPVVDNCFGRRLVLTMHPWELQ